MTAYSDIINKTVLDAIAAGGLDTNVYGLKVFKKISAAERKRTSVAKIKMDLARAASDIAKRAMKERADRQVAFGFMELPGAVSVDDDGRKIKFTLSLKRLEFKAAKARRVVDRKGLDSSIKAMDAAEVTANPYWDKNPDWTLGECLDQASKDQTSGEAA